MKRKLLFLLLPLIPIVIGIIFAIYYSIPRLEYIYNEEKKVINSIRKEHMDNKTNDIYFQKRIK